VWLLLACADAGRSPSGDGQPSDSTVDSATDSGETETRLLPGEDLSCAAPADAVSYTDLAPAWGLYDTTNVDPARKEHPPVAFADLDGDGDDDVLLADRDGGLWNHTNTGGAFTAALVDPVGRLTTLALADVDGDRDLDLFAGGKSATVRLYENDSGVFTDVSTTWGIDALGLTRDVRDGAFGDYDGDGDPDLYVVTANSGATGDPAALHRLLRNDGGRYTDVSELLAPEVRAGLGWQGVWHDFDRDGDLDLFVANAEQSMAGPSRYLRNDGPTDDAWAFTDLTDTCACGWTGSNMGATAADFNGDGWTDLFLTNTGPSVLLQNDGAGGFVNVTLAVGAGAVPHLTWMTFGSAAADHDNDGDLDLFAATGPLHDGAAGAQEPNQPDVLLARDGDGYTDVAPALGLDDAGAGRGVAFGDLDGDGFPELLVSKQGTPSRLWRPTCTSSRALIVELEGPAPNRFGVGARVEVETDEGVLVRHVDTKPGWAAASHPRAWFGLGDAAPRRLTVTWPDGVVQVFVVEADTRVVVRRE
jgi:hypothetical protein